LAATKGPAHGRGTKPCKFCEIVAGREKSFSVYADNLCAAFLDYRPLILGHVLLVSAAHYPTLADTPDEVMAALALRAKRISNALMRGLEAEGSFIALNNLVSQSVPHIHFHIVPRRKGDGLFSSGLIWKRASYRDDAQREAIAAKIRAALTET
jgi:histidine triad (HIT) family protein